MYIDFRKGNVKIWAAGLLGSGFFGVVALIGALEPEQYLVGDSSMVRFLAWICTFLFLAPFTALLIFTPKLLAKAGITVDADGIQGVGWSDLAGVGVAYQVRPMNPRAPLPEKTRRTGYVLEFFPAPGVQLVDRIERLMRAEENPPHPGLPFARYRLAIPDEAAGARIEQAVRAAAPHRWLGVYERSWTPIG